VTRPRARPARRAAVLLAGLLVGACATGEPPPSAPAPTTAARDAEVLVVAGGRTHFFENRRPHCLAFVLEGEWEFAGQRAALRTADRRRFVGVVLQGADAIPGAGDLVSRAIAQIIADTDREWRQPIQTRIEAFSAGRAGAVMLEFGEVTVTPEAVKRTAGSTPSAIGRKVRLPLRVVAPFDAGLVMVVTALDVADAQAVFSTLEVTEEPQCWRRVIRERFPGVLK
jgi:ABC-type amino acid transport substrate-binding protein